MSARITRIEIMPLPRWARLALAARCLKRARVLVTPAPSHAAILDKAIAGIENSAAAGQWSRGAGGFGGGGVLAGAGQPRQALGHGGGARPRRGHLHGGARGGVRRRGRLAA